MWEVTSVQREKGPEKTRTYSKPRYLHIFTAAGLGIYRNRLAVALGRGTTSEEGRRSRRRREGHVRSTFSPPWVKNMAAPQWNARTANPPPEHGNVEAKLQCRPDRHRNQRRDRAERAKLTETASGLWGV